jgi:hypothetical protein
MAAGVRKRPDGRQQHRAVVTESRMEEPIADTDGRLLEINPLHCNGPSKLYTSLWQMEQPDLYCNGLLKTGTKVWQCVKVLEGLCWEIVILGWNESATFNLMGISNLVSVNCGPLALSVACIAAGIWQVSRKSLGLLKSDAVVVVGRLCISVSGQSGAGDVRSEQCGKPRNVYRNWTQIFRENSSYKIWGSLIDGSEGLGCHIWVILMLLIGRLGRTCWRCT